MNVQSRPESPDTAFVTPTPSSLPLILIVEDDRQLLHMFGRFVQHAGYECISATHGAEVFQRLNGRIPQAAVIDYLLPGMSSADLITTLRIQWPWMPIILVTATTASDETLASLAPLAWLRKPFSLEELESLLQRALERPLGLS